MEQEAAQELMGRYCHDFLLAAMCVVSPEEGDSIILEGDEAMVGDGHAMGVAGQIAQHMLWSSERRLGVDHPVVREQPPEELTKAVLVG